MMPDSEREDLKQSSFPTDAAKLALITGIIPRFTDIYPIT